SGLKYQAGVRVRVGRDLMSPFRQFAQHVETVNGGVKAVAIHSKCVVRFEHSQRAHELNCYREELDPRANRNQPRKLASDRAEEPSQIDEPGRPWRQK